MNIGISFVGTLGISIRLCSFNIPSLFRPTINSTLENVTISENVTALQWKNKTVAWTWKVNIFAVDNGNPKRGDFIPFTVTFSSTCLDKAKVTVDTSGNVFFTAPGYTISVYG